MNRHWPKVRLGEVLRLDLERVPIDPSATYPMVGVLSFGRGLFDREPIENGNTSYKHFYRLKAEHVVMSQLFGWEGALALSSHQFAGKFLSPQFPTFLCDLGKLDRDFLGWVLRRPALWEDLASRASGMGDRRRTLNPDALFACEIPLPPLAEQRRIVARIEELAAQIHEALALRQQATTETEALRAAQANFIFSNSTLGKWPKRQLEEIAEIRSGVTLGRQLVGKTIKLPYLRVANVQDGHLRLDEIKEVEVLETEAAKWQLLEGDLLLTEGGDWDKLGRGTVWRNEIPNCIHQNHIFRVRTRRNEFVPEFLAALIGSPVGKAYFQEASKQTTNLASINQRQLKAFMVVQPPISEQRRIVAELDALQAEVDALKRHQRDTAAELDALLPAILDRAFRGEL